MGEVGETLERRFFGRVPEPSTMLLVILGIAFSMREIVKRREVQSSVTRHGPSCVAAWRSPGCLDAASRRRARGNGPIVRQRLSALLANVSTGPQSIENAPIKWLAPLGWSACGVSR